MLPDPELTTRPEHGHDVPLLLWRLPAPVRAISSAVLGGGIGPREWLINASVPMSYNRDDPGDHLAAIAAGLDLQGRGVGLLTGVDVADVVTASGDGVRLWATVGLGAPIQAAAGNPGGGELVVSAPFAGSICAAASSETDPRAPDISDLFEMRMGSESGAGRESAGDSYPVGTVNIVVWVPERLSDGALVNVVATVTEAKAQAIRDLGLEATGTATDAVCVLCPIAGPEAAYGGPRSTWGVRLARATYAAVLEGGKSRRSWSDKVSGK